MPAQRTTNFRFQGQRALLTYSQVGNFDTAYTLAEALVPHIAGFANNDYRWKWAVEQHGREEDADVDLGGEWHIHFIFDLGKLCTERGHIFDFGGFHPNIKKCSGKTQWKNQLAYLEKDGCWQTNIEVEMDAEIEEERRDDVFRQALDCEDYKSYLQTLAEGAPQDYCKSYLSIRACGQDRYAKAPEEWTKTWNINEFLNVPQRMVDYAAYIASDETRHRPKSLIIISPTRFGKTEWARSIDDNHAYVSQEWNLDCLQDNAKVLIFDDVPMSELLERSRWKAFFGMQREFNMTGKYRGARRVLRGWKGFIYCTNVDPREQEGVTQSTKDYITGNSYIVTLDLPLHNNVEED